MSKDSKNGNEAEASLRGENWHLSLLALNGSTTSLKMKDDKGNIFLDKLEEEFKKEGITVIDYWSIVGDADLAILTSSNKNKNEIAKIITDWKKTVNITVDRNFCNRLYDEHFANKGYNDDFEREIKKLLQDIRKIEIYGLPKVVQCIDFRVESLIPVPEAIFVSRGKKEDEDNSITYILYLHLNHFHPDIKSSELVKKLIKTIEKDSNNEGIRGKKFFKNIEYIFQTHSTCDLLLIGKCDNYVDIYDGVLRLRDYPIEKDTNATPYLFNTLLLFSPPSFQTKITSNQNAKSTKRLCYSSNILIQPCYEQHEFWKDDGHINKLLDKLRLEFKCNKGCSFICKKGKVNKYVSVRQGYYDVLITVSIKDKEDMGRLMFFMDVLSNIVPSVVDTSGILRVPFSMLEYKRQLKCV